MNISSSNPVVTDIGCGGVVIAVAVMVVVVMLLRHVAKEGLTIEVSLFGLGDSTFGEETERPNHLFELF